MSTNDFLTQWPSASQFVAQLERQGFKIIEGSEADMLLQEYAAARAALLRERIVASAKATGYAVAELVGEAPRNAAAAMREAYGKLKTWVGR